MGTVRQSPPSSELKIFSDRLQKAIEFRKIDIAALAKDSEYKSDDINKMLKGMREPSMKKLILLANSLGCSVDYLLGLTPETKRATVATMADTNTFKSQPSEHGQTSGQISGNVEQIITALPKLLEFDIELISFIIKFLIEKREKRIAKFVDVVTGKSPKEVNSVNKTTISKEDNSFDDDDLWGDIEDDEFEDDDFGDDGFEDDNFEDDLEDEGDDFDE
jgi:transcriptional regulator with XRE-family HTH domain